MVCEAYTHLRQKGQKNQQKQKNKPRANDLPTHLPCRLPACLPFGGPIETGNLRQSSPIPASQLALLHKLPGVCYNVGMLLSETTKKIPKNFSAPPVIDAEIVPKTEGVAANTSIEVASPAVADVWLGPIGFNKTPLGEPLPTNVARTLHDGEEMLADLGLVQISPKASGLCLALKLKMSQRDHVGPQKLVLPLVVLPEGAGVLDKKNAKWIEVEVDLSPIYSSIVGEVL